MALEVQIKDNKIFAPLKDKWLVLKPEEKVRQNYITRLVNDYGFSLDQMSQEAQVNNSQRGQGRAMADIVIFYNKEDKAKFEATGRSNSPIIVVECKAEHITIREDDYYQGYNYASWAGSDFFVTTNDKETRIFRVIKGEIPKKLDEIIDIPKASIINDKKAIDKLLTQTKSFTRDEFSRLLFKCHNIIRNNDKLSPEAAFDEISKILFIKIRYERDNSGRNVFSKDEFIKDKESYDKYKGKDDKPFYQFLFERTKEDFKNDDLFDVNETLKIRENSFEAIVEELQIYNLSTTSDDVKGIAFEQFLGRTFRGELGQFFTPRTVVDFMNNVLDPEEGETVCDPCCGSGGFLIKAFEYMRTKVEEDIHVEKESLKTKYYTDKYEKMPEKDKERIEQELEMYFNSLNCELDITNVNSRLFQLSRKCIYGTDANPRMSRTAKMNMIMHGDGHGGVHHNDGLLNVNGIFEDRFDVILTNPPFGARVEKSLLITDDDKYKDEARIKLYRKEYGKKYDEAMRQINDNVGKPILDLFKVGKMSTLTEVLFIERCLNLLRAGGRLGIVLPEGVLNNSNLDKIREFVEGKAKIILITSIPQDVFIASGATVKPSLMFFKKFTEEETKQWKKAKQEAKSEIETKYYNDIALLENQIAIEQEQEKPNKDGIKRIKTEIKSLNEKIEQEAKARAKELFDYQVPIAEVEKAGISTTGAEIENELKPLEKEFTTYREENTLWTNTDLKYQYTYKNGKLTRQKKVNNVVVETIEL